MASIRPPAVVPVSTRPSTLAAAEISAYWAAVNCRLHSAEKYATTTTPP